jgi:regulator of nonsense transcripts 2
LEQHINLPLAASFIKNFGPEILGIIPRKQRAAAEQQDSEPTPTEPASVTPEQRQAIKELLVSYYRTVAKHLKKEHAYVKKMGHRNHETLFARGELSEETKQRYEKATKAYEKLLANSET